MNQSTPSEKTLITLPLCDVVSLILGDNDYIDIPEHVAELIELKAQNKIICHVQRADEWTPNLYGARLWSLHKWRESTERWLRMKMMSEEDRKSRFIQQANIRLVSYHVKKFTGLEGEEADKVAAKLVIQNKMQQIKRLGVHKLIERIEDT